jgi:hypothetical protein
MKNQLADLNNHLFAQLERLSDEDITSTPEKLKTEISRSEAISKIAGNIIGNAKIILDAHIAVNEWHLGGSLPMIEVIAMEPAGKPKGATK